MMSPVAAPAAGRDAFWRDAALLVLALLAVHALNLAVHRDLWVQDEARYGEVLREMLESGRWLVPHLNGFPYPDKPPVYFWLVAALGALTGQGELAFRLFTLLSTVAATFGTWVLGRRLAGPAAGRWAALCFVTLFGTLVVGQIARMDMTLCATCVWAWVALHAHETRRSRAALVGFWLASAAGVAIKGPIALLFTVLPALLRPLGARDWAGFAALKPLHGLGLLVGGVLAWIAAVWLDGESAYLVTIWNEQLVGRAVNSWSHREPVWFYVTLLPVLLMPWTGLAVSGARTFWQSEPAAARFVLAGLLVALLAISAISGKLFIYLQPLLPLCAVLAGVGCTTLLAQSRIGTEQALLPVVWFTLLAGGIGWGTHDVLGNNPRGFALATILGLCAILGFRLSRQPPRRWLIGWTGLSAVVSWVVFGALITLVNPLYSGKPLGEAIARLAPGSRPVAIVHSTRGILNYYAGRLMTEVERTDIAAWYLLHPDALVVIQSAHLSYWFPEGKVPACTTDETYSVELKEYRVLAGCPR